MCQQSLPSLSFCKQPSIPWRGLLAVLGGLLIQFTFGSFYSLANMMTYIVGYMRQEGHNVTSTDMMVVQYTYGMTQGVVLPLAGVIIPLVGSKIAVLFGGLLFSLGPFLTSWCIGSGGGLVTVTLTYGFLQSLGQQIAILPTLTIAMDWFPAYRGTVAGLVVAGFGAGASLFNVLETFIVNPDGASTDRDGYMANREVLARVPDLLRLLGLIYGSLLLIGGIFLAENPKSGGGGGSGQTISLRSVKSIVISREFALLWLTRFSVVFISQGISGAYKAYGLESRHYTDSFMSLVGAVTGIFNCVGRVGLGAAMDATSYKTVMSVAAILLMLLMSTLDAAARISSMMLATWVWAIFLVFPGAYAMHPAVCGKVWPDKSGLAIGLITTSDFFNNLILCLVMDHVKKGGWDKYFLFLASGGIVALLSTILFPKIGEKNEEEVKKENHNSFIDVSNCKRTSVTRITFQG